jgi:hypothetical protein
MFELLMVAFCALAFITGEEEKKDRRACRRRKGARSWNRKMRRRLGDGSK